LSITNIFQHTNVKGDEHKVGWICSRLQD
jgi:hypothetical protein